MFSADYGDPFSTPLIPAKVTSAVTSHVAYVCVMPSSVGGGVGGGGGGGRYDGSLAGRCPVGLSRVLLSHLDSAKRKPVVEAEQVNNAADLYARLGAEVEAMANRLQDHVRAVGVVVVRPCVSRRTL